MVREHPGHEDVRSVLLFQATPTVQLLPSSRQRLRPWQVLLLADTRSASDLVAIRGLGGRRRSMTGDPQATSRRSPTVSRLRATPHAVGIFGHDNLLLVGPRNAGRISGCNDASGRWDFTRRCDRQVLGPSADHTIRQRKRIAMRRANRMWSWVFMLSW